MKKRGFNPFGLPTLLSILILILVYSVVSVLLVNVRQNQNSIVKSMNFIAYTYNIETETDKIIQEVNDAYQNQTKFEDFIIIIDNLESVTYDKERDMILVELNKDTLKVSVILSINHENHLITLISRKLIINNDQDYTQNGDPVYGGQS